MATTRTYAVGNKGAVVRLDAHTGPWVDITPSFPNQNEVDWKDVMADPLNPDKVTMVGPDILNSIGSGILVSTDAGATWNIPGGTWSTKGYDFQEVWYADSNVIWAIAYNGVVVQSTDGGLTFNTVSRVEIGFDNQTQCIHAIDAFTAVVGGSLIGGTTSSVGYVWKTTNGGVSWVRQNGGASLPGSTNPVGTPEGIWISDNALRIVVGTGYTQNVSTDGGATFNNITPEFTRSGTHLTWYPAHDANPAVMRHTGGMPNQVSESLDNGATWTITRTAESFIMTGAHFYLANDGYYIVDEKVYSTNDGAITGVLSYTEPSGLNFNAVWTQEDITVNPGCPCYLATNCVDPNDTFVVTVDCATEDPLYSNLIYQFHILGAQDTGNCYTIEDYIDCTGILVTVTVASSWDTCESCVNPLVPSEQCWDLEVVCDGVCEDIYAINGFDFTPYIGQNISIQPPLSTNPECWYTPYPLRQAIFTATPQTSPTLANLFGAFQQGTGDITIGLGSFIHNGVEQIIGSPPTYLLTPTNIQFITVNNQLNVVPTVLSNNNEMGYSNTVDFINNQLAILGLDYMYAQNVALNLCEIPSEHKAEQISFMYRDGDTISMTLTFTVGTNTITILHQVTAGNITTQTNINNGTDLTTCNDIIWCPRDPASNPTINGVTVMGDCPVEPVDLGEACKIVPRLGEPGFSTKNCDPKKLVDIKCKFADSVYAQFKRTRYGIDTCCEFDLDKIDIKNQLVDLGEIYDPELCVDGDPINDDCCLPPCNAVAELFINLAVPCPAPTDAVADLTVPAPPFAGCIELNFSINPGADPTIYPLVTGVDCCGNFIDLTVPDSGETLCIDAEQSYTAAENITVTPTGNDCDCCLAPNYANGAQSGRGFVSIL